MLFNANVKSMLTAIAFLGSSLFFTVNASPATDSEGRLLSLGQTSREEPAKIKNLKLSDPLVQQKYLKEPNLLRFLRGTYAEACTRGMVIEGAKHLKLNVGGQYPKEVQKAASQVLEANRIWKLTSMELEALLGPGYIEAAYYCDCVMKEVSNYDLVDPAKGLEAVENLSKSSQDACLRIAEDKTRSYVKKYDIKGK